jgi:hypothetical protein
MERSTQRRCERQGSRGAGGGSSAACSFILCLVFRFAIFLPWDEILLVHPVACYILYVQVVRGLPCTVTRARPPPPPTGARDPRSPAASACTSIATRTAAGSHGPRWMVMTARLHPALGLAEVSVPGGTILLGTRPRCPAVRPAVTALRATTRSGALPRACQPSVEGIGALPARTALAERPPNETDALGARCRFAGPPGNASWGLGRAQRPPIPTGRGLGGEPHGGACGGWGLREGSDSAAQSTAHTPPPTTPRHPSSHPFCFPRVC